MNRLRDLREQRNLTLKQLETEIGINASVLGNYERGDRSPKIEVWQKLADYFGVSVSNIMGLTSFETEEAAALANEQIQKINDLISSGSDEGAKATKIIGNLSEIFDSLLEGPTQNDLNDLQSITASLEKLYNLDHFFFESQKENKKGIKLILNNYQNIIDILNKRVNDIVDKI